MTPSLEFFNAIFHLSCVFWYRKCSISHLSCAWNFQPMMKEVEQCGTSGEFQRSTGTKKFSNSYVNQIIFRGVIKYLSYIKFMSLSMYLCAVNTTCIRSLTRHGNRSNPCLDFILSRWRGREVVEISQCSLQVWDHSFGTCAAFSGKLTFLTPWYAHVRGDNIYYFTILG